MSSKRIEQAEIEKYWEIFSSLTGGGTHLSGAQAAPILKNSQLRDSQLERVWDLADVDGDGSLDFEEFCVAMRLIFDLVNGEYADVPQTLPDWLVPASKAHLITATNALSGNAPAFERPASPDESSGLKSGFDWYMSPSNRSKYEAIYTAHRMPHGDLAFDALHDLYAELDVPDSEIRVAWTLVAGKAEAVNKDAACAFLHLLSQRQDGFRLPRTVPASLRSSFEQGRIEYDVDKVQPGRRWAVDKDADNATSRKGRFGDAYLSRLGVGDRSGGVGARGTDFSGTPADGEWEGVRLKRQLKDLEDKIARSEKAVEGRRKGRRDGGPALVKRELEMLLEWKKKELRGLEEGSGGKTGGLEGLKADIEVVREQVEGLEGHLRERERVLQDLRAQIEVERA
ncbi:hypothetical protein EJ06DRAFT_474495 [Trichodelitschia bisporula]|uniref:Endocytosis protein 3 n=1 Tax=Trichodelitschia bisporula TaxID=703511 RepID=A0A6G1I0N8_9PEZI|nr:hypothetical protein EJ06DRAFT_474495 [Trichodelitschia bisporula]